TMVKPATPIDGHARTNTTSVYTPAQIFPMLPEKLSTDLTSLCEGEDRLAVIVEMVVANNGSLVDASVYQAWVRNRAKLAYNGVAAWLDGNGKIPEKVANTPGMDDQLRLQDRVAQAMRALRYERGALELDTIEPQAVLMDGKVVDLQLDKKNRAK